MLDFSVLHCGSFDFVLMLKDAVTMKRDSVGASPNIFGIILDKIM